MATTSTGGGGGGLLRRTGVHPDLPGRKAPQEVGGGTPPAPKRAPGVADAKAALSPRGTSQTKQWLSGAMESGKCLAWPGAFVIHRPEVLPSFRHSMIVRMVLIGRSVRRISRRRSEEGQGEGRGGGSRRWVPPSRSVCPPTIGVHAQHPFHPSAPPRSAGQYCPVNRTGTPLSGVTRGVHTKERKLQGEKGGEPLRGLRPSVDPRTPSAPTSPPGNEASFACSRAVPCYLATPGTPLVASPRRPASPPTPTCPRTIRVYCVVWTPGWRGTRRGTHTPLTDETAIRPELQTSLHYIRG